MQATTASQPSAAALEELCAALAQGFDADVQATLNDIEGLPRRLLAVRSYLRASDSLRSRWSWTEAQIAQFQRTAQYRQMLADIERLRSQFEAQNPGFSLYVNTEVRSLGVQLERWNKNRTVGLLADELASAARAASAANTASGPEALRQFLIAWQPSTAIPLAAPGLSLHGRAQALDFQIRQGERIVAGTETASVAAAWDTPGWTEKLKLAIDRSGLPFRGPLLMPREPWHYEYAPDVQQPDAAGTRTP